MSKLNGSYTVLFYILRIGPWYNKFSHNFNKKGNSFCMENLWLLSPELSDQQILKRLGRVEFYKLAIFVHTISDIQSNFAPSP